MLPRLPPEMCEVCTGVSKMVEEKFGEEGRKTFLVGFFFLRFITAALSSPDVHLTYHVSSHFSKFCILMSKILQNTASGKHFEMQEMVFLNPMISSAQPVIETILEALTSNKVVQKYVETDPTNLWSLASPPPVILPPLNLLPSAPSGPSLPSSSSSPSCSRFRSSVTFSSP